MATIDRQKLREKLEHRMGLDLEYATVSGAALDVCQDGEVLYRRCFGVTAPLGTEPMNEHSLFRLASMTKPVSSVAIGTLVDAGKIRLDDPVERYLPAFANLPIRKLDANGRIVDGEIPSVKPTIQHLLSHSAGIGFGDVISKVFNEMTAEQNRTLASAVEVYPQAGLDYVPGTAQGYSGHVAFDVLARIAEIVTGTDYASFVQKAVLDPCEMAETTFSPTPEQWKLVVGMHNKVDGKSCPYTMPEGCAYSIIPTSHPLAGAGLFSTIGDYSRFARMLAADGRWNGRQVVSEDYIRLMRTPHVSPQVMTGLCRWGLAVRIVTSEDYGRLPVGAYGWSGAYGTHFWVDPVNHVTAIYLKNSQIDGGAGTQTGAAFEQDVHDSME